MRLGAGAQPSLSGFGFGLIVYSSHPKCILLLQVDYTISLSQGAWTAMCSICCWPVDGQTNEETEMNSLNVELPSQCEIVSLESD